MFQQKETSFIDLQTSLREQSIFGWFSFSLGVNRKPQNLGSTFKRLFVGIKKKFLNIQKKQVA